MGDHRRRGYQRCRPVAWALLAVLAGATLVPAHSQAQLQLGLQDAGFQQLPGTGSAKAAYRALRATNGSTVRVQIPWSFVAPQGQRVPAGFDATNPADPKYNWSGVDSVLGSLQQQRVQVLVILTGVPAWSQLSRQPQTIKKNFPGTWNPNPAEFGQFARAAALRYSGTFPDPSNSGRYLPRVKYWEIWNEENLPLSLTAPNLVSEYRALLNAAYGSLKAVHSDNVVVAGGLAPVSYIPPLSISPLKFAAQLMCLRRLHNVFRRATACPQRARFDIFAMHPYTLAATPTKHAYRYDDVLVGDIEKISSVVGAADRLHTVAPRIRHRIWVTEWGWFTRPPNKLVGDSLATAARYVAYSMYEMWRAGVSLVIWLNVADAPSSTAQNPYFFNGGGLYTNSGQPKLTLRAFGFPMIATVSRGKGFAWGRAPVSTRVRVVVERRSGGHWRQVARTLTGSDGVFRVNFRASGNGVYRAVVAHGPTSLSYDSTPIPGRRTHLFYSG